MVEGAKPLYKLPQVRQVCQDLVAARPDDPQALWLKMTMAIASVHQGDYPATDAAIQDVLAAPATDVRVTEALNHIAWACRNVQQPAKGLTIYQYIMEHWPERDQAAFAQHGIVICYQQLGNPQEADAALEVLLQKYGTHKDIAKMALWAADGYSSTGEKERAHKVFESIVQNYPDTPEAIQAQTAIAITSIQSEDRASVEPAVQTLLTRFPVNETKAQGLHDVANTIVWKKIPLVALPAEQQESMAVYNRCLQAIANYTQQTWPQSDWALWAERDLAVLALRTGNDANAAAATGRLMTQYADRKDLPEALYFLASRNLEAGQLDKADPLFQSLVSKYPDHESVPLAKSGLAQIMIRRGDDQGAEALFQEIMADYKGHPKLTEAVYLIAEGYQSRANALRAQEAAQRRSLGETPPDQAGSAAGPYFQRAIDKCQIVIEQLPQTPGVTPYAYLLTGLCHNGMGSYDKAIPFLEKLVEIAPSHQHADYALLVAARNFDKLAYQGKLGRKEADAAAKPLYERLVNRYPSSRGAKIARQELQQIARRAQAEGE
jgi:TolA-binding protein